MYNTLTRLAVMPWFELDEQVATVFAILLFWMLPLMFMLSVGHLDLDEKTIAESIIVESIIVESIIAESLVAESLVAAECLVAESLIAESLIAAANAGNWQGQGG